MARLTDGQKARLAPALRATWSAIADDVGDMDLDTEGMVEITCDADRPVTIGRASPEDYRALCEALGDADTRAWLARVLS